MQFDQYEWQAGTRVQPFEYCFQANRNLIFITPILVVYARLMTDSTDFIIVVVIIVIGIVIVIVITFQFTNQKSQTNNFRIER